MLFFFFLRRCASLGGFKIVCDDVLSTSNAGFCLVDDKLWCTGIINTAIKLADPFVYLTIVR